MLTPADFLSEIIKDCDGGARSTEPGMITENAGSTQSFDYAGKPYDSDND
jgi:hypothetical protein